LESNTVRRKRGFTSILIALLLLGLVFHSVTAWSSPLATWWMDPYPVNGGIIGKSSPTLADVNGDGVSEILVGTTGAYDHYAYLVVMEGNGSTLWSKRIWSEKTGAGISSTPAVGDIDGANGDVEIVVSIGGSVSYRNQDGGIVAYSHTGTELWRFETQDHDGNGYADGVYSSPTLCDLDGDGDMEIAFGGWDHRIYLLDHNGNSLWHDLPPGRNGPGYFTADTIWSTAACADLNKDGTKEIIIGGDITSGGKLPDGTITEDGGYLYILDIDGNELVRRFFPETVYASPAVGDLDGDGDLEIVTGTGWYWWNAHGRTEQPYVYAFDTSHVFDSDMDYSDPDKLPHLPGWPRPTVYPGFSSPALADLDEDGDLEVIIGSGDPYIDNGDDMPGAGSVYAWHHDGTLVSGWPVYPKNAQNPPKDTYVLSSPTIADVDNDGEVEILFAMLWDVHVYNVDGTRQALLRTCRTVWSSPAVGDTDSDGKVEVWVGGGDINDTSGRAYLWRFDGFEQQTPGIGDLPWPQFHRDPQNTGRYPRPPCLDGLPDFLLMLHEYGSGDIEQSFLSVRNGGDGSFPWMVTSKPITTTVDPLAGTAFSTSTVQATVVLTTTGYVTGTHLLGSIVITGTLDGDPVEGSPAVIPVTLYVGDVQRVYLPFAMHAGP
jgi:hypothetical protein